MAKKSKPHDGPMIDHDIRAECDLRTLIDAEKIRKDPSRLKAAMAKHAEMSAALKNVRKGKAA